MRQSFWVGAVAVLIVGGPTQGQERKPEVLQKLEGHLGGVSALAFNPKVSLLASGAGNGVVRLWEAKSGDNLVRIDPSRPSGGRVNHLAFSSAFDGNILSASSRNILSASSRNGVFAWDLAPPPVPMPEKKDPDPQDGEPATGPRPPRTLPLVFEDALGFDPAKIGTITGDGKRVYLSAGEGIRTSVSSQVIAPRFGENTSDELRGAFAPWAVSSISDAQSSLVAMYGVLKGGDKSELPVVAFVGLGEPRIIGRGTVRGQVSGRTSTIAFSPDNKWLIVCNGEDLMYWRVPGSQVVEGDPKFLVGSPAFAAAPGPNGIIAIASPPEAGKTAKVTLVNVSGAEPKVVAVYTSDIARISTMAFSPDGAMLAVGDDLEGVVQLWNMKK